MGAPAPATAAALPSIAGGSQGLPTGGKAAPAWAAPVWGSGPVPAHGVSGAGSAAGEGDAHRPLRLQHRPRAERAIQPPTPVRF